ncbi:MAG: SDR family oxidoreductase [Reyranellaceae bacterium]
MPSQTLLILGAGYAGQALARLLAGKAWRIKGTSRSAPGAAALAAAGIEGIAATADTFDPVLLEQADALLVSVPPDEQGDPFARSLAAAKKPGRLRWIGYLSTTGVYGDTGGAWVDETAPPNPSNARGRRRLLAEAQWFDFGTRHGLAAQAFRLPGIYGPGRSALDEVRAGRARRIDKPGQVFSRIHVADIAATLAASLDRPAPGTIYNVADDLPAPSSDVVAFACELLGVPPPPLIPYAEIEATLSPMGREFYADTRRVGNERIKRELGIALAYPTYREGLRGILETERLSRTGSRS